MGGERRRLGLGFPYRAGRYRPGEEPFSSPVLSNLNMCRRAYNANMGLYRVVLALPTPGWGFHAVRGGVDLGRHRFRPQLVGVVDVWKDS